MWMGAKVMPEWIAMEHYRLDIVEQWPDGPYKTATLDAIHSSLAGLLQRSSATDSAEYDTGLKRRNGLKL
jgi:hypothetical protein